MPDPATERKDTPQPDLRSGFPLDQLPDGGMVVGRAGTEDLILVRQGTELFAVGAHCTHYHGPLADGLVVGDTVRCPWHHACFSLRTGEALRAPALDPIACWRVEQVGDVAFVREKLPERGPQSVRRGTQAQTALNSILIVGGGGAGLAAADMLRRDGYEGSLIMISADESPPYDRQNISKDFIAGTAQDDWNLLRQPETYDA